MLPIRLSSTIVTKSPKNVLKTKISPIILSSAINLSKRNVKQQQLHKQEIGRRRRRRQLERKENAVENCSLKYLATPQKMSHVSQNYFYYFQTRIFFMWKEILHIEWLLTTWMNDKIAIWCRFFRLNAQTIMATTHWSSDCLELWHHIQILWFSEVVNDHPKCTISFLKKVAILKWLDRPFKESVVLYWEIFLGCMWKYVNCAAARKLSLAEWIGSLCPVRYRGR